MNTPDKNALLREVLGGEEITALRDASLSLGLEALRRRRRRRQQWQGAAWLGLILLLAYSWRSRPAPPVPTATAAVAPAVAASAAPAPEPEQTGEVKYITKRELFALFPHRPIALIGEAGHQQFLLLDDLPRRREQ
jgi:peptidoglycan/LPS O-acetylase OafA/YrhL